MCVVSFFSFFFLNAFTLGANLPHFFALSFIFPSQLFPHILKVRRRSRFCWWWRVGGEWHWASWPHVYDTLGCCIRLALSPLFMPQWRHLHFCIHIAELWALTLSSSCYSCCLLPTVTNQGHWTNSFCHKKRSRCNPTHTPATDLSISSL